MEISISPANTSLSRPTAAIAYLHAPFASTTQAIKESVKSRKREKAGPALEELARQAHEEFEAGQIEEWP